MEINEIKSSTAEIKLDRGKPSWYSRRQIKNLKGHSTFKIKKITCDFSYLGGAWLCVGFNCSNVAVTKRNPGLPNSCTYNVFLNTQIGQEFYILLPPEDI